MVGRERLAAGVQGLLGAKLFGCRLFGRTNCWAQAVWAHELLGAGCLGTRTVGRTNCWVQAVWAHELLGAGRLGAGMIGHSIYIQYSYTYVAKIY